MKTTGKKINGRKVFTYVFLTIAALISLFPFYFMFVSATNTNAEILSATPKLIFGSHLVAVSYTHLTLPTTLGV